MADQYAKKPNGSQNPDGEEAGPDDLASLWGGASAIETPKMEEISKKIPKAPKKQTDQNITASAQREREQAKNLALPERGQRPSAEAGGSATAEALLKRSEVSFTEGEVIKPPPSPEPLPESETEFLEEGDSLAEKLEDIFSEFHIDIKKILLGIVFFALIVAGAFYGYKGVKYFLSNRKSESQTEIQKKPEEEKILPDSRQTGLKTVLLFGRPFFLPQKFFDGDVFLSVLLGEGKDRKSRFNYYVALLKRMQNAYGTDIKAMLDAAADRRSVLLNHLARLRKLQEEGIAASQSIGNELQRYEPVVESIGKEQKTLEDGFFAEINALNPNTESFLNQFIEKAKQQVSVRARFRSLQTVQKFFNQALPRLDALIKDIDLNQEPLIAGLKVYDVKGSDLELIIPVNNGSESEKKNGFPLLAPIGNVGSGSWEGITIAPPVYQKKK